LAGLEAKTNSCRPRSEPLVAAVVFLADSGFEAVADLGEETGIAGWR
jgi:hypothetical protein